MTGYRVRVHRCCEHCGKWDVLAPDDRLLGRFLTFAEANRYARLHLRTERELHADYQRLLDTYAMRGKPHD